MFVTQDAAAGLEGLTEIRFRLCVFALTFQQLAHVADRNDRNGVFVTHVFPWLVLANPADAFRLYNLVLLDGAPVAGIDGLAHSLPAPPAAALLTLGAWAALALGAGIALTRRLTP